MDAERLDKWQKLCGEFMQYCDSGPKAPGIVAAYSHAVFGQAMTDDDMVSERAHWIIRQLKQYKNPSSKRFQTRFKEFI